MKTVIVGLSKGLSDTVESWENSNSFLHRVVWRFFYGKKEQCKHEEYDMDNQIRAIRCRKCGHEAFIKEVKNLYSK